MTTDYFHPLIPREIAGWELQDTIFADNNKYHYIHKKRGVHCVVYVHSANIFSAEGIIRCELERYVRLWDELFKKNKAMLEKLQTIIKQRPLAPMEMNQLQHIAETNQLYQSPKGIILNGSISQQEFDEFVKKYKEANRGRLPWWKKLFG